LLHFARILVDLALMSVFNVAIEVFSINSCMIFVGDKNHRGLLQQL
jgi:hypothetical protein